MTNNKLTTKQNKFIYGRIPEAFIILPYFDIRWMRHANENVYDFYFAWLFWYFRSNNIGRKLGELEF